VYACMDYMHVYCVAVCRYPCVYLACKVEEFNVTITNFVTNMSQFSQQDAIDLVLSQELLLMQMLYYHLTVHSPYRPVEGLLIDIKVMKFITCCSSSRDVNNGLSHKAKVKTKDLTSQPRPRPRT